VQPLTKVLIVLWEQFLLECLLWVLHSYPCWLVELLRSLLLLSQFLLLVRHFSLIDGKATLMIDDDEVVRGFDDCVVVVCRILCELREVVPCDEAI